MRANYGGGDGKYDLVSNIFNWCKTNDINVEGMMKVIEARDEMIEDFLTIGLDPFYNGYGKSRGTYNLTSILRENIEEGMEEVRKIKVCIYEGYRLNLFIWNDGIKSYVSHYNHYSINLSTKLTKEIATIEESGVKQTRPQKLIIASVVLKANKDKKDILEYLLDFTKFTMLYFL
jgi:hypothetical protein